MGFVNNARFPSDIAEASDLLNLKNQVPGASQPTLAAPMGSGDTSATLASGVGAQFPLTNFVVSIDDEIIFVTTRTGDTLSPITRAFEGTAATAHLSGASVDARITAQSHNQNAAEINAIETALGEDLENVAVVSGGPPQEGQVPIFDSGSGTYVPGDPIVSGPDAVGTSPTRNPVQVGGLDPSGHVQELVVDSTFQLKTSPNPPPNLQENIANVGTGFSGNSTLTMGTPPSRCVLDIGVLADQPGVVVISYSPAGISPSVTQIVEYSTLANILFRIGIIVGPQMNALKVTWTNGGGSSTTIFDLTGSFQALDSTLLPDQLSDLGYLQVALKEGGLSSEGLTGAVVPPPTGLQLGGADEDSGLFATVGTTNGSLDVSAQIDSSFITSGDNGFDNTVVNGTVLVTLTELAQGQIVGIVCDGGTFLTGSFQFQGSMDGGASWSPLQVIRRSDGAILTDDVPASGKIELYEINSNVLVVRIIATADYTGTGTGITYFGSNGVAAGPVPTTVQGSVDIGSIPLPANAAQESGGNLDAIRTLQGVQGTSLNPPSGGSGIIGFLSGIYSRLAGVILAAGTAIIGKVGIDQTTPGTTNKVSIGSDGTVAVNNFPATQPISAVSLPLPTGASQDGTDNSGVSQPSGGVGIRGWLSAIYNVLKNGSLAVTGTFFQATQPVSGTVAVSNFPGTQPVSGTVTANQGTANATPWNDNVAQWGATAVTPPTAGSPPASTDAGPTFRPIQRRGGAGSISTGLLTNAVLGGGANFTSAWFDSWADGTCYLEAQAMCTGGGGSAAGFQLQESDDQTNNVTLASGTVTAGVANTIEGPIRKRYYRIFYQNGATLQSTFTLYAAAANIPLNMKVVGNGAVGNSTGVTVANAVGVTLAAAIAAADGIAANPMISGAGVGVALEVADYNYNGASFDRTRSINGITSASPTGVRAVAGAPTTSANQACSFAIGSGTGGTLTAQLIKNSAGNVFGAMIVNPNAAVIYLQFYNKATTPVPGTDTVVWFIPIPANSVQNIPPGLLALASFATGIGIAASNSATGAGTTITAPIVTLFYV